MSSVYFSNVGEIKEKIQRGKKTKHNQYSSSSHQVPVVGPAITAPWADQTVNNVQIKNKYSIFLFFFFIFSLPDYCSDGKKGK